MIFNKVSAAVLILTLFVTIGFGQNKTKRPVKVFLLGGQSNMDGCGLTEELPDAYKMHPENTMSWDNKKEVWTSLGKDSFAESRKYMFGPEIAFSHQLAIAFPDFTIAVIKTSAGGTKLWKHWLPGQPMYVRFLKNMENALRQLTDSGVPFEICGMLWMQGESDSETVEWANAYEGNLKILFADVRKQTRKEELPIVMGRISSSLLKKTPWNFDHAKIVQKAQEKVAAKDKNVFIIQTDRLKTLPDNTHFNTEAQIWLGTKMGKIMVREI